MNFQDKILSYLAELAAGKLSLTFEDIHDEPSEHKDLLYGIFCLKEELDYHHDRILQLSRSRQQILDVISDVLFFISQDGEIQVINTLIYDILGYSSQELDDLHISDLLFDYKGRLPYPCADFQKDDFQINHLITQIKEGKWIERQLSIQMKNGIFLPVLVNLYVLQPTFDTNISQKILCSIKDASDSRLVQELQEKQSQLVQASKLASLGELSSGIAHELNNPLFAIIGFNRLVGKRLKKKHPEAYEEVQDLLGKIDIASERMSNIISHVQLFARQEKLNFKWAGLHEIINNSFILMNEQLRVRNISVTLDLQLEETQIYCSPNRLEQVFVNLIANARDAILEKKTDSKKLISVKTLQDGENIQIIFSDTGSGMPKEMMARIFDPFFTTKEPRKGTGLGLSISYGILQDHNAEIEVKSEKDVGTSFIITFLPYPLNGKETS